MQHTFIASLLLAYLMYLMKRAHNRLEFISSGWNLVHDIGLFSEEAKLHRK